MLETWVWSLGWEDPPEKGMATHSSILACRVPWTEEPGGLQSMGPQRVRQDLATKQQTKQGYTRGVLSRINYCPTWCWITKNVLYTPSSLMGGSLINACAASLHVSASISSLFQVFLTDGNLPKEGSFSDPLFILSVPFTMECLFLLFRSK